MGTKHHSHQWSTSGRWEGECLWLQVRVTCCLDLLSLRSACDRGPYACKEIGYCNTYYIFHAESLKCLFLMVGERRLP